MNALPSYSVLNFMEWLTEQNDTKNIRLSEVLLESDYSRLYEYANKYLENYSNDVVFVVRGILQNYMDRYSKDAFIERCMHSSDFEKAVRYNFGNGFVDSSCIACKIINSLKSVAANDYPDQLHQYLWSFLHDFCADLNKQDVIKKVFDPRRLVDSLRYFLEYSQEDEQKPFYANLLNSGAFDLGTEIDFLRWLDLHPIDLSKMPMPVFKVLVNRYLDFTGSPNSKAQYDKLVKSFRKGSSTLSKLLMLAFPNSRFTETKSLAYIHNRYTNPSIRFKCFFLPLAADKVFEEFLFKYWMDLHEMTGDYLDIFYSVNEINDSGYSIRNRFAQLSVPDSKLPCIVLWCERLEDAKYIEIGDLTD